MASESDADADPEFDWSWTEERDGWVPPAVDPSVFSAARVYDYFLGGKDNFAADREAAEKVREMVPDAAEGALANRRFLERVVRALAEEGITQFIDLGSGIPTSPSVHQIARRTVPDARVVYADNDPMAVAHSRALLAGSPGVLAVQGDLRWPQQVLEGEQVRELIDFEQPVALLMIAVLHFVPHEVAPELLARYRRSLAPGSYLAMSVACRDGMPLADVTRFEALYAKSSAPVVLRTAAQIDQLFDGLELLEPGIVEGNRWRADEPPISLRGLGGVGRVR